MMKKTKKLNAILGFCAIIFTSNIVFAEQYKAKEGTTNVTLYKKNGANFDRKESISGEKFNKDNIGPLGDKSGENQGFVATKLGNEKGAEVFWVRVSQLQNAKIVVACPRSGGLGSSGRLVIASGQGAGEGCK